MAFAAVPTQSRSQIKKAGELLTNISGHSDDHVMEALGLAVQWRACHAYPINTFQATLRDKVRGLPGEPIVAQRLKRMPTIIEKLQRYPAMNLATMHDIAGVRAILDNVSQVRRLCRQYIDNERFEHELARHDDYIEQPRDADGYRSIHLIYKYKNPRASSYNGLRIEMQLRTKLQHSWATAVETMGTVMQQALKSRRGNQEWLDFFAVISSAFAYMERTPRVPRFSHMSKDQTAEEVRRLDKKLSALTTMDGISMAAESISRSSADRQRWFYHLIVLDSQKRSVELKAYDRESIEQANRDYTAVEARAAAGEKIEPVLVSAGPIDKLKRAYPSFFLDVSEFVKVVRKLIS